MYEKQSKLCPAEFYDVGVVLKTRDGRKIGNAIIIKSEVSKNFDGLEIDIETDFGNVTTLTTKELASMFHEPTHKTLVEWWRKGKNKLQCKNHQS